MIANRPGWEGLGDLVATAAALANTVASDPLNHVLGGYSRFRRYTPRMLRTLDIEASPVARPLLEAVDVLRSNVPAQPTTEPGVKAYSHVSDRFSPFATQTIPATVHEAPYILDGLLMNETGRRVREQYADTGGFTDHVFAACSILGYTFVPRIRDLPSKRLYVFEPAGVPKQLRPLVGGKVNADLIDRNWVDILRVAATMAAGTMRPSQILRKLAAYPRQNELAAALREVGRIERSLFMIDWTTDPGMRRRAQVGLNKGEAHHALKRAINFHQRGELRDRTEEGQHYRVAGLNLLAAIIIYWNTLKLGEAVFIRKNAGLDVPAEFLAHASPLGWEHINLTGEYRWPGAGPRST